MKIFFFLLLSISVGLFSPGTGSAEVNVNIVLPLPGPIIPAPPGLIVIPGTYVYYPPDLSVDIFFFRGHWYRPYRGGWYRAGSYNGPWTGISSRHVPGSLHKVPRTYRRVPSRHAPVAYGDVQKNWKSWERDRYWDRGYRKSENHGKKKHEKGYREGHDRGPSRGNGKHDRG